MLQKIEMEFKQLSSEEVDGWLQPGQVNHQAQCRLPKLFFFFYISDLSFCSFFVFIVHFISLVSILVTFLLLILDFVSFK